MIYIAILNWMAFNFQKYVLEPTCYGNLFDICCHPDYLCIIRVSTGSAILIGTSHGIIHTLILTLIYLGLHRYEWVIFCWKLLSSRPIVQPCSTCPSVLRG